jgi:hypothetical protein
MARFQAKLFRSHLSATEAVPVGSDSVNVPLNQSLVVTLDAETDLFDASQQDILVLAGPLAELEPRHPEAGWGPWQLRMLRDHHEFKPPEPLRVAADSPAGALVDAYSRAYPTLFLADAFTPYRVLKQALGVIGAGLRWRDGALTDGKPAWPQALPAHQGQAELARAYRADLADWSHQLLLRPPVSLYPLSPEYSLLFSVPGDVEDSYLVAAMQFCEFVLRRPVWENHAYTPAELTGSDPSPAAAVWKTDAWRHIALADGMKYRTIVEQAYARLVLGPLRPRLLALGFEDKGFAVNYALPPRARKFDMR